MNLRLRITLRLPGFSLEAGLSGEAECLALFGPSGAGKSLTLQCLAGLRSDGSGSIAVDGRLLQDDSRSCFVPPRNRRVGYVPQSAALFPHLSVRENLEFGLQGSRLESPSPVLRRLVVLMRLQELEDRRPHELSGGQRQRVALARAVASGPGLLLLDEPFSALDDSLRETLIRDLCSARKELGFGMVLVTHDLSDVLALADRVALFDDGRVLQEGPVRQVLEQPRSERVARLTGARNVLEGRVESGPDGARTLRLGGRRVERYDARRSEEGPVSAVLRAERLRLLASEESPLADEALIPVVIRDVTAGSLQHLVTLDVTEDEGIRIEVAVPVWWWERHCSGGWRPERLAVPFRAIHLLQRQ